MKVYRICYDPYKPSEWFVGSTFCSWQGEKVVFVTSSVLTAIGIGLALGIEGDVYEYRVPRAIAYARDVECSGHNELVEYREEFNPPAVAGIEDIPLPEGIVFLEEVEAITKVW